MNPDHPVRIKVACINWREPDAPHALAYTVNAAGEHLQSRGFPTWLGRDVGGLSDCAAALGIDTPAAHTALGDARTARAIWDAILGGRR